MKFIDQLCMYANVLSAIIHLFWYFLVSVLHSVSNSNHYDKHFIYKTAYGWFGQSSTRIKHLFYNHSDQSLQGSASPNNKPVWKTIDCARIVNLLSNKDNELMAVVEIKKRWIFYHNKFIEFWVQQLPLLGNGYPNNLFQLYMSKNMCIKTPIVLCHWLYLTMYNLILTKWRLVTVYRFLNRVMVETLLIFVLHRILTK